MCNPKMCKMKTTVITLISLMFMIPLVSFADGEGERAKKPKAKIESAVTVEAVVPARDLIVINLDETANTNCLPQDILDQFEDVMAYPEDVVNAGDEEIVLVGFSYDDEGFINVQDSNSSNESFTDHVVSNIEKIRLRDGCVTIGKHYYAKFSFKKL